jgi:hypothetical protein
MQTQRTKSCRTNHDIEATAAQSRTHPFIKQRFRYKSLIILTEPGHVTSPPAPHPQTSPASQTSSATNPPSTALEPQITLAPSPAATVWQTRASRAETISSSTYETSTTWTFRNDDLASAAHSPLDGQRATKTSESCADDEEEEG